MRTVLKIFKCELVSHWLGIDQIKKYKKQDLHT